MAKDKKRVLLEEPTFDKQMEGYSEGEQNENDPVFSRAYHAFMVNLLKTRDKAVTADLIKEVEIQNGKFSKKLLSDVNDVIENQWIRVLNEKLTKQSEQLNSTMTTIAGDVNKIKINLETLEKNQVQDEIDIAMLKQIHELPKNFDNRLKIVEDKLPVIEDLRVYASPKWTSIRWGIAIIIASLLILWLGERFPGTIHKIFGSDPPQTELPK